MPEPIDKLLPKIANVPVIISYTAHEYIMFLRGEFSRIFLNKSIYYRVPLCHVIYYIPVSISQAEVKIYWTFWTSICPRTWTVWERWRSWRTKISRNCTKFWPIDTSTENLSMIRNCEKWSIFSLSFISSYPPFWP